MKWRWNRGCCHFSYSYLLSTWVCCFWFHDLSPLSKCCYALIVWLGLYGSFQIPFLGSFWLPAKYHRSVFQDMLCALWSENNVQAVACGCLLLLHASHNVLLSFHTTGFLKVGLVFMSSDKIMNVLAMEQRWPAIISTWISDRTFFPSGSDGGQHHKFRDGDRDDEAVYMAVWGFRCPSCQTVTFRWNVNTEMCLLYWPFLSWLQLLLTVLSPQLWSSF